MSFDKDKEKAMRKLKNALKKGEVDKPIITLLNFINSLKNYYTTSSCSGRVILLNEYGKRKIDHSFIIREHEKVDIGKFIEKIENFKGERLWLKQEAFIIHIAGRTLKDAIKMLNIGLNAGLKHSGVFVFKDERYILELNGTQHLEVPIAEKGKIFADKEYLIYLLTLANGKLNKNKIIREKFEELVKVKFD
ncbi:MAG: hypothetical protein B6U88_02665 [Candidatus Aenigmarchaeota archaeon ex4484_56]|nr:MAG: hypothetical protein B6U88_02665 [Candidatus Aenigmarchaeota archaeon ex4484_56]